MTSQIGYLKLLITRSILSEPLNFEIESPVLIMGECCLHASLFIFDRIIIKVAGNQDRHKSLDEFNFGPDQTINFGELLALE